jgi:hypothetical protein
MHLSNVYFNYPRYAIVYHTAPDSSEVEFVKLKFFKSEKKAWQWFNQHHSMDEFIQPEVVKVSGLNYLNLERPS